jgi:tetratricopeptide (TPR) repeat protein
VNYEEQKAAVTSFEEAVRIDPQFALAWAALSRANSRLFFSGDDMPGARRAAAEKALNEATRLQPELAETQLARASYQYWVLHDYPGALEMLRKLQASWPNNADVLEIMAFISARLGQWTAALDYAERSMRLNPKDFSSRLQAIGIAQAMRQFSKVSALIDGGLQIWPNDRNLLGTKALVAQAKGQLDEAESILKSLPVTTGESDTGDIALFYQGWVRRDPSIALKSFDALD